MAYRSANLDKIRTKHRNYYSNNRELFWAKRIEHRYGITKERYDRMLEFQGGGCAVCGTRSKKRLHVDHDHSTGAVRGLLCKQCNLAAGYLRDDPVLATKLAEYLSAERTNEKASQSIRTPEVRGGRSNIPF